LSRLYFLFLFLLSLTRSGSAQNDPDSAVNSRQDSLPLTDTFKITGVDGPLPVITIAVDSISKIPPKDNSWKWNDSVPFSLQNLQWEQMKHNPYFGFASTPITFHSDKRQTRGKEFLFYLLIAIMLGYAFLKNAFPKYFTDLFRLFFRTTLKQRQIKEQLMQTPLPSMLLNGFFVITGGLYISFLLQHYNLEMPGGFWPGFAYCCLGLSAIYFVKFVGLKISGWLFSMSGAADNYIFIVFVVNKMIAILLLPFLILLAFATPPVYDAALTLSLCLVGGLFCYRIILSFAAIRNQVKVNPFHFF
jgi:hypothetical protein